MVGGALVVGGTVAFLVAFCSKSDQPISFSLIRPI